MTESRFRLGRRPALDGVRAVAIIPVMGFHAGLGWADGGYLGVDVFFVLSGFLITSLLLEELDLTHHIRLAHFYARRALRLLPALAVLLILVGLYAVIRPNQLENQTAGTDILGTMFYVFNWVLVRGGARLRMLSHAWSLSIEEQFYLLWPLTLVVLTKFRVSRPAIAAVTVVGFAASLITRIIIIGGVDRASPRLNVGLDTRGGALLVGCFLALAFSLGWVPMTRLARQIAGAAGVIALVWLVWMLAGDRYAAIVAVTDPSRVYVEGLLLLEAATAVIIVSVILAPNAVVARVLSLAPIVWIGQVSYGLYLFHYPVDRVFRQGAIELGLDDWQLQIVRLAVTLAITTASFYLVERPMLRLKSRFSHRAEGPDLQPAPAGGQP
jgi:peptidoglycan/LPS O-acetylase OafA/YrhL